MKYLIVFFFIYSYAFSLPFTLNQEDVQTIKNAYQNKKITTRLLRYKEFLQKAEHYDLEKKLNRVNSYINRIRSKHDKLSNKNDGENTIGDYWMTPKEFFIAGSGDCEDYAIAKFFTLQYLGVDPKHLLLSVVKVKGSPSLHMVLLYLDNKDAMPLVLDNLSWKVLPLDKRGDLEPLFAFNETCSRGFKDKKIDKKIKIDWGKEDKWSNFLDKLHEK